MIELVVAIAALAVAMTVVLVMLFPRADQGAQLLWQVRGAELAGRILDELGQYPFDENSGEGGRIRCDEAGTSCTAPVDLGPDAGESLPALFDDLDDFHGFGGQATSLLSDLPADYGQIQVGIQVVYDGNGDGVDDNAVGPHKLVRLALSLPGGDTLTFARYRSNY
ncbi:hypothetical protein [Gallaecimonas sp. GXIMD4217]|uniref:hypothetical protein n=1 Tax=Gallaecimonas sp. GXIMD4217 TaxID=3131927 RepID=UPI00311B2B18